MRRMGKHITEYSEGYIWRGPFYTIRLRSVDGIMAQPLGFLMLGSACVDHRSQSFFAVKIA